MQRPSLEPHGGLQLHGGQRGLLFVYVRHAQAHRRHLRAQGVCVCVCVCVCSYEYAYDMRKLTGATCVHKVCVCVCVCVFVCVQL